jgi:hypothetical protein
MQDKTGKLINTYGFEGSDLAFTWETLRSHEIVNVTNSQGEIRAGYFQNETLNFVFYLHVGWL